MTSDITDIELPTIVYEDDRNPDEVHEVLAKAQRQGPVGLEVLRYDLVRIVLRDSRFVIPQGIGLVVQGITSGRVWDRVTKLLISLDGAEHHRLRRLVSTDSITVMRRTPCKFCVIASG